MKAVSCVAGVLALTLPIRSAASQITVSECHTFRAASTVVGAGLGAAVGAIPATVVHRHDKQSSHTIMAISVSGGALTGLLLSARGHPCTSPASASSTPALPDPVVARREDHAWKGALSGAVVGGILGAAGGTMLGGNGAAVYLGVAGGFGGGILGSLVGWAWPVR